MLEPGSSRTLISDPIRALAEPEILRDPGPVYAWLLEHQPVFWYEPLRSWMVARHADCLAVLRNSEACGTDWRRVGEEVPSSAQNLQSLDPPEQIPVRRLFLDAVRAQDVRTFARVVDRRCRGLLAALRERGSFDFVTDFAEPLALSATTYLLGVPNLARAVLFGLVRTAVHGDSRRNGRRTVA